MPRKRKKSKQNNATPFYSFPSKLFRQGEKGKKNSQVKISVKTVPQTSSHAHVACHVESFTNAFWRK